MNLWRGREVARVDGFDTELRLLMLEAAKLATANIPRGNFFDSQTALPEQVCSDIIDGTKYTHVFGGRSWVPLYHTFTMVGNGDFVFISNNSDSKPTKYELFLEETSRAPLQVEQEDKALWIVADIFKQHRIKKCEFYALDTIFRYGLKYPGNNKIRRSAHWRLMGIRKDLPDVELADHKFNPVKRPSTRVKYAAFWPDKEWDTDKVSGKEYKMREREVAVWLDRVRIQRILKGLGWAATDKGS